MKIGRSRTSAQPTWITVPQTLPDNPTEKLLGGALLLALSVVVHSAGLIALGRSLHQCWEPRNRNYACDLCLLVRMAWMMTLLHLITIGLWAWFFHASGGLPDRHTEFYFSSATDTTAGYGDMVLPHAWHTMSGLESLTGFLSAGLTTGFFFHLLNRTLEHRTNAFETRRALGRWCPETPNMLFTTSFNALSGPFNTSASPETGSL